MKKDITFHYSYVQPPGVFATIITSVSLADSTGMLFCIVFVVVTVCRVESF